MDHIDKIAAQWNKERRDLDIAPMALIGRLKRISSHLTQGMNKTFSEFGLNSASFDVLATLRRSGEPYCLSPSDLLATMMVTSGTMTNRIDQLEKSGLVERIRNPKDGRGFIISLTEKGFNLIDAAVGAHVETQHRLVSSLSGEEKQKLNSLLTRFLAGLE